MHPIKVRESDITPGLLVRLTGTARRLEVVRMVGGLVYCVFHDSASTMKLVARADDFELAPEPPKKNGLDAMHLTR